MTNFNKSQFIKSLIILLIALLPQSSFAGSGTQNVQITGLSEYQSIKAGSEFYIGLKQTIAKDWHTYWRNPGDVGDATRIEWEAPKGVEIGAIEWPAPSKLPYADFINYGYSGEVILPIKVKIPANLNGAQSIKGKATWLECKDVCVPGEGEFIININIGENIESPQKGQISASLEKLPKPLQNYSANWVKQGEKFHLGFIISEDLNPEKAYFYPYEVDGGALIDHAKPQELTKGIGGFGLYIIPSPSLPVKMPEKISGVIEIEAKGQKEFYEINAIPAATISPKTMGANIGQGFDIAKLLGAVGFAILGGIILNLMPCVFPVLAMKIFGLTKIAHNEPKIARNYGVFYGAGVMASFLLLGGLLFALKSLGAAIGWGFQLQDPSFLLIMIVIIIALGLNLLGLFEIGTSLQNLGTSLTQKSGNQGAFFSGALAVAVASPCTAPFMGAALGYAITQSAFLGLLVFLGLGIGFALPFIILTFSPKLLALLPKPGTWMDGLKKFLALPMFLTAFWLIWVLSSIVPISNILKSLAIILIPIFIFIFMRKYIKNDWTIKASYLALLIITAGGAFLVRDLSAQQAQSTNHKYQAWSEEAVEAELAKGRKVFVNFTADWCITCKVNEKNVFENKKVQEIFAKNNITYLVADWTKKDAKIARALSSHGRAGVPLYLVYDGKGDKPRILPQILTPQAVINAIEK